MLYIIHKIHRLAEVFEGDKPSFKSNKFVGKTNYKSPEIVVAKKTKKFNAKSNDIWCVGICLFMMINGISPWNKACDKDPAFDMVINGNIIQLLDGWNKLQYVDMDLIALFQSIFKYEQKRCNLDSIKNCAWLQK